MRLELIRPPLPYLTQPNGYGPLGLGYLASYVRRELPDVDVRVQDMAVGESPGEADVYGFSATSLDYERVVGLANGIAERYPNARIVLGGAHATVFKERCDPVFSAVFVGEGEASLVKYMSELIAGKTPCRLRHSEPIRNLDRLPYPLRVRPEDKQLVHGEAHSVTIMASRGCPYSCTFCASESMWTRKMRWRSPENVIGEIRHCIDNLGVTEVAMIDDTLTVNRQWLHEFCRMVMPLKIHWRALSRVDLKDARQTFHRMKMAGCTEVCFGVESFDPAVLAQLDKRTTPQQAEGAILTAHNVGLNVRAFMMIGTPGESVRTADINIEHLKRISHATDLVSLSTFTPLPGTAIYDNPELFGIEIVDRDLSHLNRYQWGPNGENPVYSTIRIGGMTQKQQYENIRKMREYVGGLESANRGIPT